MGALVCEDQGQPAACSPGFSDKIRGFQGWRRRMGVRGGNTHTEQKTDQARGSGL